jgi:nucleotide-binding universal stress UspA family protein
MYMRILVATDGSPLSRKAIAAGVAIAKVTGGSVVGFHARPPKPGVYAGEASIVVPSEFSAAFEREAIRAAEKYLAEAESVAKGSGVSYKGIHRASESPADAILQAAREEQCDLIVMASHGRKGISRVLLGSETTKVLTHATQPVLVTH